MAKGDIADPVDYGSIVRNNLMKRPGYAPYCMGFRRNEDGDTMETICTTMFHRMSWNGEQFLCRFCGSRTEFPADFITGYKARWHGADKVEGRG